MSQHLLLSVHFHGDGLGTARYHGQLQGGPEWPPSPARVFQALVAAVARGSLIPDSVVPALEWLEGLPAPTIASPHRRLGQRYSLFVPNNDADALADPRDISSLRVGKLVQPSLFAGDVPILYAWPMPADSEPAWVIRAAAHQLYQLGRGLDPAWADAEVIEEGVLDERLERYLGVVQQPEPNVRGETMLPCPTPGSLASLMQRQTASRLTREGAGRRARTLFANAPKARFMSISYSRAKQSVVYELRTRDGRHAWPWSLVRAVKLVETLRDAALTRLCAALPEQQEAIERALVGRNPDDRDARPAQRRVRILPLPSIGFEHADRAIRRVLIETPSGSSLSAADVRWAFSGLEWVNPETGVVSDALLAQSDADQMLPHYTRASRYWRSVTAVALPESASRRRIEPRNQREDAKPAAEVQREQDRAVAAVHTALRHAGVRAIAVSVHVQREPFEAKGSRAEAFALDTRFAKERLWHIDVELDRSVEGPLVLGDGRFLGLGVMAPVSQPSRAQVLGSPSTDGVYSLQVLAHTQAHGAADSITMARALRRAVMARVQHVLGRQPLGEFFSGHTPHSTAASETGNHLAYQWDALRQRLLVIAPHRLARRSAERRELEKLRVLEEALSGFVELRAGRTGLLQLRLGSITTDDPLLAASRHWTSLTPYTVTRHTRQDSAHDVLIQDVVEQCSRQHLPRPHVTVIGARGELGRGLQGELKLEFAAAVVGPVLLGRTRFLGGGAFVAAD